MNYKLTVTSETGNTFDYLLASGTIENLNNISEVADCFVLNNPNPRPWIIERIMDGHFKVEAGNFSKRYDKVKMNWVIE
jgi:hypothetical protein